MLFHQRYQVNLSPTLDRACSEFPTFGPESSKS
jgi:hypothetical protein